MAWTCFELLFKERYIPRATGNVLSAVFHLLKRGDKTSVAEYATEFTKFTPYAPHLVDTEDRKTRKFEDDLRPEILVAIKPMRLETCSSA